MVCTFVVGLFPLRNDVLDKVLPNLPKHDFDRSLLNLNLLGIEFSTWRFVERLCSKFQFWMKVLILWPSTRGEPMGTHFYDSCRSSTSLTPFDSSIVVLTMRLGWRDVSTHMTHHDISNLFMSLSNIKHTETLWNIGNLSHVYIGTLPWRSFICQKFWKWSTARLCWWKLKWLEWVVLAAPKKDVVERSKLVWTGVIFENKCLSLTLLKLLNSQLESYNWIHHFEHDQASQTFKAVPKAKQW